MCFCSVTKGHKWPHTETQYLSVILIRKTCTLAEAADVVCLGLCVFRVDILFHIHIQIHSLSSGVLLSLHWSSHPTLSHCRPEWQSNTSAVSPIDQNQSITLYRQTKGDKEEQRHVWKEITLNTWAEDVFGRLCRWLYKNRGGIRETFIIITISTGTSSILRSSFGS